MNSEGISRGNAHLNLSLLCHRARQAAMHLLSPGGVVSVEDAPHSRVYFFIKGGGALSVALRLRGLRVIN